MSFEAELKKFELSSVFTINFSWLKRYVESDNGMYTPMKNISDDEFREIESSFYALQATWKAWREAKAQAVPEGYVVVPMEPTEQILNRMTNAPIEVNHLCDNADIFLSEDEARIAYKAMIEAQEPAND